MKKQLADYFEGKDILWYFDHPEELRALMDEVNDDELTRGRIRSIYVQKVYGSKSSKDIAKYYNIPVRLVDDIAEGRIFSEITMKGGTSYE